MRVRESVGIKRHLLVDTQGLVHGAEVTTANVTDRQDALLALQRSKHALGKVKALLADGGYTGQAFAHAAQQALGSPLKPTAMNCTPLKSCPNAGSLNAPLLGLTNAHA